MDNQRRPGKEARLQGFVELLIEGSCFHRLNGFRCVQLEEHPFKLNLPEMPNIDAPTEVWYLADYGTDLAVRSLRRMVAWEMTNGLLGQYRPVHFLRVNHVQTPDSKQGDCYLFYEVAVGRYLFMTGGCTNCSGTGKTGARKMDQLFTFLSQMYGVTVNHARLPATLATYMRNHFYNDVFNPAIAEVRQWNVDRRQKEAAYTTFKIGDMVTFTQDGVEAVKDLLPLTQAKSFSNHRRKVLDIENIPDRCSCGLGDSLEIMICHHPERLCNLRRRHESMHHQYVTVELGDEKRPLTGHYLVRAR